MPHLGTTTTTTTKTRRGLFSRRPRRAPAHHAGATTTTTRRRGFFGRRAHRAPVVHHHKRHVSLGDKISGALLKLKGTLTHRPGVKAAGTRRMNGTDGRGSHRV
ncbi:hypothetical protein B0T22DRAFT_491887 [Podospora appendiculata]|uniref:Uncharacterized protein n=1 Tax=Podospora appendiculata TaxID=314037 RepID=A0AAE0X482_9PEZI|nr:hypothetical protein B0T22DRAFT_491887 [Podospora appendiculata]